MLSESNKSYRRDYTLKLLNILRTSTIFKYIFLTRSRAEYLHMYFQELWMPDYTNFISLIYSIFSLNYVHIVHTYTHRYSQMVPKPFTLQKKKRKKETNWKRWKRKKSNRKRNSFLYDHPSCRRHLKDRGWRQTSHDKTGLNPVYICINPAFDYGTLWLLDRRNSRQKIQRLRRRRKMLNSYFM